MATNENGSLIAEQAYEGLRQAIVRGELRPNERLVEVELAKKYEISRTPIREVLQRLETEGFVESRRRGWIVHEHTADEIREIYETRAALEGYAVRLAAQRATDEQLERIREIHADEDSPEPRTARDHLVELNDDFHLAIVEAAGNKRLEQMIRQTREYFFNYRIARLYSDEEARSSVEQHEMVVKLLLARDAEGAERVMREHIGDALVATLDKLR